jgi:hypothetical protein
MNLSFLETKKERASARKTHWFDQLSDTAKKFTHRCFSVSSNREERENQRSCEVLSKHIGTKERIIKSRKMKAQVRHYQRMDNQEDQKKR